MDGIQEIDTVLQHVRRIARRFRISSDAAITQQILLLGDAFYGYRFTAMDFTAIWSAVDQTLSVCDRESQTSEFFSLSENVRESSVEVRPSYPSQLRAA